MGKMNGKMNYKSKYAIAIMSGYSRSGLIKKSGNALIMIVLLFAMLLVLGTGAVTLASSTSRRAINETKQEQAYIAARSVSMAIKDQIVNITDAEDRTKFVEKLKAAPKDPLSGNTNLTIDVSNNDVNYELLPVEAVGTNLEKYTVRATYAGVSEDYSFVLLNTPVSTPVSSSITSFMTGSAMSQITDIDMESNSLNIPALAVAKKVNSTPTTFIKSKLYGDVFVDGNVVAETNNAQVTGSIIASGDVAISGDSRIDGDIYAKGKVTVSNGATVTGSIFSTYYINNPNENEKHVLKSNLSLGHAFYSNTIGMVSNNSTSVVTNIYLHENKDKLDIFNAAFAQLSNIMDNVINHDTYIPDWALPNWYTPTNGAEVDWDDWENVIVDSSVIVDNKVSYDLITSSGKLSNNQVGNKKLIIDATQNPDKRIILFLDSNNYYIKNTIETKGEVYFYLKNGNLENGTNIYFEGGSLISNDEYLKTFILGEGDNTIHASGNNSSVYAFIYVARPGGSGSGKVKIEGYALNGYKKFKGLVMAPDITIKPDAFLPIEVANPYASSDGSGGTGGSTSGYTYAGIIK